MSTRASACARAYYSKRDAKAEQSGGEANRGRRREKEGSIQEDGTQQDGRT